MTPLLQEDFVPVAIRHCLSLDMAEPVVVLPLSTRMTLTSTSQRASHLRQWNQPASVLTLVLKQLTSLQYTRFQCIGVLQ